MSTDKKEQINAKLQYSIFHHPNITEAEIAEVADTLRSGWITTGPKTKRTRASLVSIYTDT